MGLICVPEGSLGANHTSKLRESRSLSVAVAGTYTASLDGRISGFAISEKLANRVTLVLSNVRVVEVPDQFILKPDADPHCLSSVIARKDAGQQLTYIKAALIADARYTIHFDASVDSSARFRALSDTAATLGLAVSDTEGAVIEGTGLIWGVMDDAFLLNKLTFIPPAAGGGPRSLMPKGGTARVFSDQTPIDYKVTPLRQPSSMSCWAAAATMMLDWKMARDEGVGFIEGRNASEAITTALSAIGDRWHSLFHANNGIKPKDQSELVRDLGVVEELPQSPSPQGWQSLLREHGPLWVTTSDTFSAHARLLVGSGGVKDAAYVRLIDPADGEERIMGIIEWAREFEAEAKAIIQMRLHDVPLRYQIIHW